MLKVSNLCKNYPTFKLDNVTFNVPKGTITGFLGENGAGKSTTLKSILNIVHPDSGEIKINDLDIKVKELEIKQNIGFMLGQFDYYPKSKLSKITKVYKNFYPTWNDKLYKEYLVRFNLDENKKICELSSGMKVKYGLALALSHNAKLLILDEPTSGLDPIARDDLLDLFREIVNENETSILFSTHITTDLDKCCDDVLMINNGKIILQSNKDILLENNKLIFGKLNDLSEELKSKMISFKINKDDFKGLILKENLPKSTKFTIEKPNLDDIMIYYSLGVKK